MQLDYLFDEQVASLSLYLLQYNGQISSVDLGF